MDSSTHHFILCCMLSAPLRRVTTWPAQNSLLSKLLMATFILFMIILFIRTFPNNWLQAAWYHHGCSCFVGHFFFLPGLPKKLSIKSAGVLVVFSFFLFKSKLTSLFGFFFVCLVSSLFIMNSLLVCNLLVGPHWSSICSFLRSKVSLSAEGGDKTLHLQMEYRWIVW